MRAFVTARESSSNQGELDMLNHALYLQPDMLAVEGRVMDEWGTYYSTRRGQALAQGFCDLLFASSTVLLTTFVLVM
jgi:hypothetical protein